MGLMQIPRRIEYALRAMIHLADRPDGLANGMEIARREQIPKYFLEKVVRDLMRGGLVRARRGPGGGYQLSRAPETISFKDIIESVEGPISLNVCLEGSNVCSLQPGCRMFRVWEEGQRVLLDVFAHTTLKQIAGSTPASGITARADAPAPNGHGSKAEGRAG